MRLRIDYLGPVKQADVSFEDLTVFVGPQATGKSLTLQLLKLLEDTGRVQSELRKYGIDWGADGRQMLDVYFGEGMGGIWSSSTRVEWDGEAVQLDRISRRAKRRDYETVFLIPAQRVLALRDGWPRPFSDYAAGDPFAVREFSETLRRLLEGEFTKLNLFPQKKRLKASFRQLLTRDLFSDFELRVDKVLSQKRLVLGRSGSKDGLPQMVWSAGQREFIPLLLGLYWLMPPTKVSTRDRLKWVVIEEPEMGLHPRAINVVLLMVLELLRRGYKVCLSTHSPQVLELVWAMRHLRGARASADELLKVLGAKPDQALRGVAQAALEKQTAVYHFDGESKTVRDISELDSSAQSQFEASWGGLTDFSERANTAVAKAVAGKET